MAQRTHLRALVIGVMSAASCGAIPAYAQDASAPPSGQQSNQASPSDQDSTGDIIVTAQRREERLQDVPIAVSAISASQATEKGLTDTAALSAAVPSLVFNNNGGNGNIYLRGVGANLFDPSAEQSVATYIDGVYIAVPSANVFSFNNIERIEVLKGPQGTLFGRNATGGLVQVITRDPSNETSVDASVGYANYDTASASAYATTGVTDSLAADLSVLYENQGRGWGRNLTTGAKTFRQAVGNISGRTKWKFEPSVSTKITLAVDYAHIVNTNAYQSPEGRTPFGLFPYPGRYNSLNGLDMRFRLNTGGAALRIEQDIGRDLRLLSITTYRRSKLLYALDQDTTPIKFFDDTVDESAHNWSQEIQLSNSGDHFLSWMVGAYYFNSSAGYLNGTVDISDVLGTKFVIIDRQQTESGSVFGQGTVKITDNTNLTVGMRYTTETQRLIADPASTWGPDPVPPGGIDKKQDTRKLTWRVSLDHHFNQDVMAYLSYNRGFKSGGFNLLRPNDAGYKPEQLDAVEIGLKTDLFDKHLRFNIDSFYYWYARIQGNISTGGGVIISNGPSAQIWGVEADFEARPVSNLSISGGLSFIKSRYTENASQVPFISPDGALSLGNAKGNDVLATPRFTGQATIAYRIPLSSGALRPSVTVIHNSGFFWFPDNRLRQPAYTLLNASLGWTSDGDRFGIRLWAKNLTDERYFTALSEQADAGDVQLQAPPRTYGVTLSTHF